MKKTKIYLILALFCSAFGMTSCMQKTDGPGILKVTANLKNLPDTVYAILMDSPEIIDTIVAKDGCFEHSFHSDYLLIRVDYYCSPRVKDFPTAGESN